MRSSKSCTPKATSEWIFSDRRCSMPATPEYEIYAMKYAERQADLSTFMMTAEPGREAITIDYFVWLLQGGAEPVVVDTGFTPQIAEARKRKYVASPADQLRKLGVDPTDVKK